MKKITITICAGTACYLMGASHLQTMEESIPAKYKPYVEIKGVRCLGLCDNENYGEAPYVMINQEVMADASLPKLLERLEQIVEQE